MKKKLGVFGWIFLIFLGIMVMLALIFSASDAVEEEGEATDQRNYHFAMESLKDPENVPVSGEKAVACIDEIFTTQYVPEELQTENPEEVRFIVYCTPGEKTVGYYSNGGGTGLRHTCTVEIYDRETGETVKTHTFEGGDPPETVSGSGKKHYGSEPSEKKIQIWVEVSIEEYLGQS